MTPKQRVLSVHSSGAFVIGPPLRNDFSVYASGTGRWLGNGSTRRKAWADAAKRLRTAERSSKT